MSRGNRPRAGGLEPILSPTQLPAVHELMQRMERDQVRRIPVVDDHKDDVT
ncbi:MAG TPA: hypothetical protein VFO52_11930 [Longimicrobiales bacterium]|nr:hypothetical protein [Longimicrobiales bacterium]